MVVNIIVSVLGFIYILYKLLIGCCSIKSEAGRKARLTLRECEYLEYIRENNLPLYGDVIQSLYEERREESVQSDALMLYPDRL